MVQMKELHSRNMKMLKKMREATQESVQERDAMQRRMEGALKAQQAVHTDLLYSGGPGGGACCENTKIALYQKENLFTSYTTAFTSPGE